MRKVILGGGNSLDKFIEGDIDEMLDALIAEDQAERLAEMENG